MRARAEDQESIKKGGVCDGDEDHREYAILQHDNSQAVAEGDLLVLKRTEPGCLPIHVATSPKGGYHQTND